MSSSFFLPLFFILNYHCRLYGCPSSDLTDARPHDLYRFINQNSLRTAIVTAYRTAYSSPINNLHTYFNILFRPCQAHPLFFFKILGVILSPFLSLFHNSVRKFRVLNHFPQYFQHFSCANTASPAEVTKPTRPGCPAFLPP